MLLLTSFVIVWCGWNAWRLFFPHPFPCAQLICQHQTIGSGLAFFSPSIKEEGGRRKRKEEEKEKGGGGERERGRRRKREEEEKESEREWGERKRVREKGKDQKRQRAKSKR